MLMKAKDLNDLCDKLDESNMSGDIAQVQLFEKEICC